MNTSWIAFRTGIDACTAAGGRPMLLSVEYCKAQTGCAAWVSDVADLWRSSGDVQANWLSILGNLDAANANADAARSGHYNDPGAWGQAKPRRRVRALNALALTPPSPPPLQTCSCWGSPA